MIISFVTFYIILKQNPPLNVFQLKKQKYKGKEITITQVMDISKQRGKNVLYLYLQLVFVM